MELLSEHRGVRFYRTSSGEFYENRMEVIHRREIVEAELAETAKWDCWAHMLEDFKRYALDGGHDTGSIELSLGDVQTLGPDEAPRLVREVRAHMGYWPKPPADCPFPAGPCVLADEL